MRLWNRDVQLYVRAKGKKTKQKQNTHTARQWVSYNEREQEIERQNERDKAH